MNMIGWVVTCVSLKDIAAPFLATHPILVSYLIPTIKGARIK